MKRERTRLWLAWLGTFLLFASVAHGNFETTDAGFTMHAARSIWMRGDSALLTEAEGGQLMGERLGAQHIKSAEAAGARKEGKIGTNGHAYVWFPMGHVFLMVPFVAVGEQLQKALPDADERLRAVSVGHGETWLFGHPVVTQGLISLLVPSLCIATSILLLYRLARLLGARTRDAACTALAIGFATQAFSVGREQLSDGPGLMLLLLAMVPVARLHLCAVPGADTRVDVERHRFTAWWAGTWSGLAVLVRYQTALAVIAFAVVVLVSCRRRRSYGDLLQFAIGGAPWLCVFVLTNYLRYGDPLQTGYPEVGDWFQSAALPGLAKLLFAAGRGIMWFSPLLWLGVPMALRGARDGRVHLRWLAWLLFVTPLLIFMTANGWQGGQAWAIRYVTPGVVALLAIVLPQTTPWRRWPKLWGALVAVGLFVNLTSVIAPVRGQIQLMDQAVRAREAHAIAAGELAPDHAKQDSADVGGWRATYSPLWRNWLYAWHACGGFEDEQGRPRHGDGPASASGGNGSTGRGGHGIAVVYGVQPATAAQDAVPRHWTDRCFRHLWWRFWGDLYGVSGWLLVLPVVVLGMLSAWLGWRGLLRASDSPTQG